jgi:hypothetical protein
VKALARSWRSLPSPVRKAAALTVGGLLLASGVVMLVLPGPGLLTIAAGIAVLAAEFDWVRSLAVRTRGVVRGRRSHSPRPRADDVRDR